jgi:hypothetical protein
VCFHGSAASFPFSFNAIEPPSLGFMVDATALLRNLLKKNVIKNVSSCVAMV